MLTSALLLLVHLVAFAAYLGAGFAQLQLVKSSQRSDLSAAVRNDREVLAAAIVTRIELPAIVGSILSGVGFVAQNPTLMKLGWLHGKLLCVLVLAILSHLEMFNLRAIVRARQAGASDDAIHARKRKHAIFGTVGTLVVVALLLLVTVVRLGVG